MQDKEIELTFFVKLKDLDFIARCQADFVKQVQYDLPIMEEGRKVGIVRTRSETRRGSEPVYTLTTKRFESSSINEEHVVNSSDTIHQMLTQAATTGMIKDRYYMACDKSKLDPRLQDLDLVWEIDLYPLPGGSDYHRWAKVDLEFRPTTQAHRDALGEIDSLPIPPIRCEQVLNNNVDGHSHQVRQILDQWEQIALRARE